MVASARNSICSSRPGTRSSPLPGPAPAGSIRSQFLVQATNLDDEMLLDLWLRHSPRSLCPTSPCAPLPQSAPHPRKRGLSQKGAGQEIVLGSVQGSRTNWPRRYGVFVVLRAPHHSFLYSFPSPKDGDGLHTHAGTHARTHTHTQLYWFCFFFFFLAKK